ncbi:MAG: hypothetical protein LAO31_13480 [Acidobacteriia bacterium]|nr:hypothetical protein [Terriglobia bacterium]
MAWTGILMVMLMILWFALRYARMEKKRPWPIYGLLGLLVILAAEGLLWMKVYFVVHYFTPLVWSGYILVADAAVYRLTSRSRLHDSPGNFLWLALWSIPLWLVFEAYNLHLRNWSYLNLPQDMFLRYVGYGWAFATIWPALFETTDLLNALEIFEPSPEAGSAVPSSRLLVGSLLIGWAMLVFPLMVPQPAASYLFGSVWLGMIFALDPINYWLGRRSLWREWLRGHRREIYSMLLAGLFCGFLWEFWNYWAIARWRYVFPIMQGAKIFEMPLAGYLGFPPFCVECFVMFEFVNFRAGKSREKKTSLMQSYFVDS